MPFFRFAPASALVSVVAMLVLTTHAVRRPVRDRRPLDPVCQCGEVCDGVDNDCDGEIDEEIPDVIDGNDVAGCQRQIQRCINGRFRTIQAGINEGCELKISARRGGGDGTEVNEEKWIEFGIQHDANRIGHEPGAYYDLGLRFFVPELEPGQRVEAARVSLAGLGHSVVDGDLTLRLVGLAADSVGPFRRQRPSQYQKTTAATIWRIAEAWPGPNNGERKKCMPFRRYTPDLAPIINEILRRPKWGSGPAGKTIGLVIEDVSTSPGTSYVMAEDSLGRTFWCRQDHSPILELYPTVRSAFVGKELLGRVSDRSVTVNAHALIPIEVGFSYGTVPGNHDRSTPLVRYQAGAEIEQVLDGLLPNRRYYYRMLYRRVGREQLQSGPERTFFTQRAPGEPFTFVLQSDSHVIGSITKSQRRALKLYRQTLLNALASEPDFMLDLGDTFHTQYFAGRDAKDLSEAFDRHLTHRAYFDLIGHSVPLFFVIGNHEGEQGWRLDGTPENIPVWATKARKLLYPNPRPDNFFSGIATAYPFVGQRESVYAFEWGSALFVALDPFWHTESNPHPKTRGAGSQDPWRWTLGKAQYDFLRHTLARSRAQFKFVFIHHLTGGLEPHKPYARGAGRAVKHALGKQGSYEWGGEDKDGRYLFAEKRPGWGLPVHALLVKNDVTVVFHGHDHCFAWETVDDIVYLGVPPPSDHTAGYGFCGKRNLYAGAILRPNSGHIAVSVNPRYVQIDYLRSRPRRPDLNGDSVFSAVIYDCNRNGVVDKKEVFALPGPRSDQDCDTLCSAPPVPEAEARMVASGGLCGQ